MDYQTFLNNEKTKAAVVPMFEIIGEASKNIKDDVKEKYVTLFLGKKYTLC